MTTPTFTAEETSLATLAGELRITLGKLVRRLREQTPANDFTSAQKSVWLRLDRDGPATVSALAQAESVLPQSVRSTVAVLQAMGGAVNGVADPVDGRQTLITLTDAFRQHLQAHRSARSDWLHGALETQLSAAEQTQLAAAVTLLQRLADH